MWLIFLLAINLAQANTPPSSGPRYAQEAEITWQKAMKKKSLGQLDQAAWLFRRITSRYPGFRNYLKAHLELGMCEHQRKNYRDAVAPLKYFTEFKGFAPDGIQARITLGESYLGSGKLHEGLFIAKELIDLQESKKINLDQPKVLEALLLKTQALLMLKREKRAQASFDAYENSRSKIKTNLDPIRIGSKADYLKLKLKMVSCSQYPTSAQLSEEATRDQLQTRGLCLLEGLNIAKSAYESNRASVWFNPLMKSIARSMEELKAHCVKPPAPKQKLTQIQLKRYREELVHILKQDCTKIFDQAMVLVSAWNSKNNSNSLNSKWLEKQISKQMKSLSY